MNPKENLFTNLESSNSFENDYDLRYLEDNNNTENIENIYEPKTPKGTHKKETLKSQQYKANNQPQYTPQYPFTFLLSSPSSSSSSSSPPLSSPSASYYLAKTSPYKVSYLKESQLPNLRSHSISINSFQNTFESKLSNKENELHPMPFKTSSPKSPLSNHPNENIKQPSSKKKTVLLNTAKCLFGNTDNIKQNENFNFKQPNTAMSSHQTKNANKLKQVKKK